MSIEKIKETLEMFIWRYFLLMCTHSLPLIYQPIPWKTPPTILHRFHASEVSTETPTRHVLTALTKANFNLQKDAIPNRSTTKNSTNATRYTLQQRVNDLKYQTTHAKNPRKPPMTSKPRTQVQRHHLLSLRCQKLHAQIANTCPQTKNIRQKVSFYHLPLKLHHELPHLEKKSSLQAKKRI